ncbi:MAG: hypothetical protein Q7U75_09800, partial [Desulfobacterales bacterium]|nr:hypothetical protein [Desulfobacterales bacterium]
EERATVVEVVNRIAAPTRLLVQEVMDALSAERVNVTTKRTASKAEYMAAVSDVLDHIREGMKTISGFGSKKPAVVAGVAALRTMETEVTQELLSATTGRPVVRGAGGSAADSRKLNF